MVRTVTTIAGLKVKKIRESKTDLYVPDYCGVVSAKMPVFYNPVMQFSRTISVIVVQNFIKKYNRIVKCLDGLAATGARGIRIANEVLDSDKMEMCLNDHNKLAYKLICKNIDLNKLTNAYAFSQKVSAVLANDMFDYIDIDPFGTPVFFLDTAVQAIKKNGLFGLTATDTAPLCGINPSVCMRRYLATPHKGSAQHEYGLRILAGYCIRTAAKYDIVLKPVLLYYADHYFRLYFTIDKGSEKANKLLKSVRTVKLGSKTVGPLWTGSLYDKQTLKGMADSQTISQHFDKRVKKYIELWLEECNAPIGYYETAELARLLKKPPLPLKKIAAILKQNNYFSSRTHFSPTAFKTNASLDELKKLL